jgi:hypothetical protein
VGVLKMIGSIMQAHPLKSSKRNGNVKNSLDNPKVSHICGSSGWLCHILCRADKFCC